MRFDVAFALLLTKQINTWIYRIVVQYKWKDWNESWRMVVWEIGLIFFIPQNVYSKQQQQKKQMVICQNVNHIFK